MIDSDCNCKILHGFWVTGQRSQGAQSSTLTWSISCRRPWSCCRTPAGENYNIRVEFSWSWVPTWGRHRAWFHTLLFWIRFATFYVFVSDLIVYHFAPNVIKIYWIHFDPLNHLKTESLKSPMANDSHSIRFGRQWWKRNVSISKSNVFL